MTLDELFPASFRGIPFLVNDTNTSGGPKQVVHEYPNDTRRYVESLGAFKKTFNLTGIITGGLYTVNRNALQSALEDGSIGILVHPFYGIANVSPLNYTVRESTTRLGEAVFDMNFVISDPAINPTDSGDAISKIIATSEDIDNKLQSAFSTAFKVSTFLPNNYAYAKTKMATIIPHFNSFKQSFGRGQDTNLSKLTTQQNIFLSNLPANINKPTSLALSVSNLFDAANSVSEDPLLTGQAFQGIFDFGLNDIKIASNPSQARERRKNNLTINYIFNIYALMYAYLNFSQVGFEDDVQLNLVSMQLEQQYRKIILGDVVISQPVRTIDVIDSDTLLSLESMRNLARLQFDADSTTVAKIDTVRVGTPTSLSLISYQYYGETSETTKIIALNDSVDVSFASGDIRVRTGAGLSQ